MPFDHVRSYNFVAMVYKYLFFFRLITNDCSNVLLTIKTGSGKIV